MNNSEKIRNGFKIGTFALLTTHTVSAQKPNVLFVISDDQSYPHASAYGSKMVSTPAFDFVAKKGCLFTNAYVCSPGSSPSRAAILTGLYPWQLEEAGTHASSFSTKYVCYPDVLKDYGYFTGYTGKGWGPGNWKISGRPYNPAGPEYNDIKLQPPYTGISKNDYASNFKKFLSERPENAPFCFWFGAHEPHRDFEEGSWRKEGYSLNKAEVNAFLPDADLIRGDLLDYAVEIEWFDQQLMKCIEELKRIGELDNTIIIVTADNGMAFPHAKANCYDDGIHVPLAICWGNKIKGSQVIDALVSTISIAPTLYEVIGIIPEMNGVSLIPLMKGEKKKYKVDSVFAGRERHSYSRYDNLGYPVRAMRWGNYLLIRNFKPYLYPAGDPKLINDRNELEDAYCDIDDCPSKTFLIKNSEEKDIMPYFDAAVAKRPEFELFDLKKDKSCMNNVANDPKYAKVLSEMKKMLHDKLVSTKDTRTGDNPDIWETYPRLEGKIRQFPQY